MLIWALGGTTGCEGGYENLCYRIDCRDCTEVLPTAAQMWKVSGLSRESNYVVANAYSVVVIAQKHTDT